MFFRYKIVCVVFQKKEKQCVKQIQKNRHHHK